MLKMLVLIARHKLSNGKVKNQLCDRLPFFRFLGLGVKNLVADARPVRSPRDDLAQSGLTDELFC